MVRAPSIDKNGLKKGAWSVEEDNKLRVYVQQYGHWNWRQLPRFAGLARCGKSCRLRWMNYLRPGVRRGHYSREEEELILKLHEEHGNKWSLIASKLDGRTDNEIKNHWHTHLRRRMKQAVSKPTNATDHPGISATSDHNEEYCSSSHSTLDSIPQNNPMETNNADAFDHIYGEVSSFCYDPTVFDWNCADAMSPLEPITEPLPFGETLWSQPFTMDSPYYINHQDQELPAPLEDHEILLPFSPFLEENDLIWLHELIE